TNDLLPGRLVFLKNMFDYLYISPNRASTKKRRVDKALYFTEWFMNNGYNHFLESEEEAILAYVYWTKEIERQIKSGELNWSRKSAEVYQAELLQLFQTRFGDEIRSNLQQAIYSLTGTRPVKAVRSSVDAGEVLQSLNHIAKGLSDLVVKEADFPHKMEYQGKEHYI
ncbi:hypothetical protein JGD13_23920, partial [Salmonella enterica subsp. enterica serovar Kentucky]|nr:hypothetical protein [Salmonella enterica subsp. enterica serovar Kentucky]